MLTGIDHVVIACHDPHAAAVDLEQRLGVVAAEGGRHEGLGTYNRIIWLADAYLELIGVDDREAALRHPLGNAVVSVLDERGGGFVSYAIASDAIETDVATLRAAGSTIGEVVHGSRRRPDDELVEWWTAMPQRIVPDAVPFLIMHAMTGSEWGPGARAVRERFEHPLGGPAVLARLEIAVEDPPSSAAQHAELLGLEFWAVADLAVAGVGRHAIRLIPSSRIEVPGAVVLGAPVSDPRSVEALGVRFDVERVELPLPAPNQA
jgi:hypothetical protein